MAPIITPLLKYFCTKGYTHIIGTVVTIMTAYFISSESLLASWAAQTVACSSYRLLSDEDVPDNQLQRL